MSCPRALGGVPSVHAGSAFLLCRSQRVERAGGREPNGVAFHSLSRHWCLCTVHLRYSVVAAHAGASPEITCRIVRERSSLPFRKPHCFLLLEQGPQGPHSLISHWAGERKQRKNKGRLSPLHTFLLPRFRTSSHRWTRFECSECLS